MTRWGAEEGVRSSWILEEKCKVSGLSTRRAEQPGGSWWFDIAVLNGRCAMRPLCGVLRRGTCHRAVPLRGQAFPRDPHLSIIRVELETSGVSLGDLAHLKEKKLQPGHRLPWAGWDQFAFELAGTTGTTRLL